MPSEPDRLRATVQGRIRRIMPFAVAQRLLLSLPQGLKWEVTVRRILVAVAMVSAAALAACDKTGEGEYEVERPVMGTVTDTVQMPTVDVGTDTVMVTVPDVDVKTPSERKGNPPS